jgi:hypothetical protein
VALRAGETACEPLLDSAWSTAHLSVVCFPTAVGWQHFSSIEMLQGLSGIECNQQRLVKVIVLYAAEIYSHRLIHATAVA